ncbi:wax ester/triacylglycerol synthase domain-containing protein [Demequina silvatica]|uniref:wax ester/triacylglycerol synthase domain-containing protein n=1 Tax=Demequina silvatica TaxID=1638988 RepID=UPI000780CEBA|nr:wax ester/triacylglycerol synthase domain-containing protein [Demequina silvatica]
MGDPDALSPSDQVNLMLEGVGVYVLTVVGLAGVGGAVAGPDRVDLDSLRATIDQRSAREPRLRRTVAGTEGGYRLVDAALRIEDHVRVVDRVDGMAGLDALCGTLASTPLPRDKPLWELLVVPGANPDGIAWVSASITRSRTAGPPRACSTGCSTRVPAKAARPVPPRARRVAGEGPRGASSPRSCGRCAARPSWAGAGRDGGSG